jgi:hypothetical protein
MSHVFTIIDLCTRMFKCRTSGKSSRLRPLLLLLFIVVIIVILILGYGLLKSTDFVHVIKFAGQHFLLSV